MTTQNAIELSKNETKKLTNTSNLAAYKSQSYHDYQQLKLENPRLFAVELAEKMGISEGELALIRVGFETEHLNIDARTLLAKLSELGTLKAITRNHFAVSEQIGEYLNQDFSGHAGLVLNPGGIDLRLFFSQWLHIFAFTEGYLDAKGDKKIRRSIQFFNQQGVAIHKIYATESTNIDAWQTLVNQYAFKQIQAIQFDKPMICENQSLQNQTTKNPIFENQWRAMTDVHQFFGLLKTHNLTRQAAFRAVSDDLAYQIDPAQVESFLQTIQREQNSVMFFVSNMGCVQIFTGKLEKVVLQRGWLNVYNRDFTLHLQHHQISEAWITRKPTQDGIVTSLELFAEDGTQILQMYGQRSEGHPEQTIWRDQLETLSRLA